MATPSFRKYERREKVLYISFAFLRQYTRAFLTAGAVVNLRSIVRLVDKLIEREMLPGLGALWNSSRV